MYKLNNTLRPPIEVDLEFFEKTDLDHELDKTFGPKDLSLLDHATRTYRKYMAIHGSLDIVVVTDLLESREYKVMGETMRIKKGPRIKALPSACPTCGSTCIGITRGVIWCHLCCYEFKNEEI